MKTKKIIILIFLCTLSISIMACNAENNELQIGDNEYYEEIQSDGIIDTVLECIPYPTQEAITDGVSLGKGWEKGEFFQGKPEEWKIMHYYNTIYISLSNNNIIGDNAVYGIEDFKNMNEFKEHYYSYELETTKGKILGTDYGEFGGAVNFIPNSGKEYKLIDENFQGFYMADDRVFVFTGSSMLDYGNIYELSHDGNKWSAVKTYNLESCPAAYMMVDDIIYLITNKTLLMIENGDKITTLYENSFWEGLSPNSMILANSNLYVGLKGGMFSFDLDDNMFEWYFHELRYDEWYDYDDLREMYM